MVNQQLKDYIAEQVRVGVSKDVIKGALLEAGWVEAEVSEAMGNSGGAPRIDAIAPLPSVIAKQPTSMSVAAHPIVAQKPAVAVSAPKIVPMNGRQIGSTSVAARPVEIHPAALSAIAPTIAAHQNAMARPGARPARPMADSIAPVMMSTAAQPAIMRGPSPMKHRIIDIVMGLLILVLGAAAAGFFVKSSNLSSELGTIATDRESSAGRVADVQRENEGLRSENAALANEKKQFEAELAIFVSSRVAGEEQITVTGVLGRGADKVPHTMRTAHGVMLTLRNSRLSAVESLLQPLFGVEATIVGTHQVGSKDVTIVTVNGAPIPQVTSSTTPR